MNSLILQSATRFLMPLMLLFSVFLLLRGHNEPGGGFSGGLVATGAIVLFITASGVQPARRALGADPHFVLGAGLMLALISGSIAFLEHQYFLTSIWWHDLVVAPQVKISLGTPLLFDFGVYLTVLGATSMIAFELMEESR